MPRKPRIFADGAIYHVYCRFAHGARVFAGEEQARRFINILHDVKRTDELTIFAWCVMPTHYHVALRTARLPLWRSLRLIQGRFAVWHNRSRRTLGPLWQGRYKARLVSEQSDLERLVAYIHLNPVKAGLVRSPAAYRLSGHRELLGRAREPLSDVEEALRLYGTRRGAAMKAYESTVRSVGRQAWSSGGPGGLPWWRQGQDADELRAPVPGQPSLDALGASTSPSRIRADLAAILAVAADETGVGEGQLASEARDRAIVRARELVALLAVHRCGLAVNAVGRRLGKPPDTVSRWLTRGTTRCAENHQFRRQLQKLEDRLRRS
jgi:putative transposase